MILLGVSNEGWDAIAFSILFVCATLFFAIGIWKTGKWPWE